MLFAAIWMDLKIIILIEVSQTKTNIIWYHMWNQKLYKGTYLQNRNRLRDIGGKNLWLPKWKGRGGINYEFYISKCKLPHIEWINNKVLLYSKLYSVFCNNLYEQNLKKNICVSESLCYTPETSTTLYIKYTHSRTTRRSKQSTLKEINPEYSLERLMLKLKLQYLATWCEELTHWKTLWYRERLRAKEGGGRGWDG